MSRRQPLLSVLGILVAAVFVSSAGAVDTPRRFVYAGDAKFPPYDFLDAAGRPEGFNVEIVQALAKDAGVDIEIRLMDWSRARADLDAGRADLISLSYSTERASTYQWLARTWAMRQCILFSSQRRNHPTSLNDLGGETIAVQERSAVAEALLALPEPKPALMMVASQGDALQLLKSGVATGVAGNSLSLSVEASQIGLSGLLELPVKSVPYGLFAAKGRSDLDWVSGSLARLEDAGVVQALAEKYLGVPPLTPVWRTYAIWALALVGVLLLALLIAQAGNIELRRRVEDRTKDLETALGDLRTRSRILEAVGFSAARLLEPGPWTEHVDEVLARLVGAVNAGCAYIFRNDRTADALMCRLIHEWAVPDAPRLRSEPALHGFAWPDQGPMRLLLEDRKVVSTLVRDLPEWGQQVLGPLGLKSILIVPIFVDGLWWGFLGFGDFRTERQWIASETEALLAGAATLGAALMRDRDEEAVRVSEKKHRDIVTFAPAGIYESRKDGTLISANREFARLLGYERPEDVLHLSMPRDVYLNADDRARLIASYETLGHGAHIEIQLKRRDGSVFWAEISAHSVTDEEGNTLHFEGFIQDITTRKEAEDEVRASEERYRRLFEGNPLPMILYDVETTRFLDANDAALTQYGYTREELPSLTLADLASPLDAGFPSFIERRLRPRPDLVQAGVKPQRRKDGSTIEVEITSLGLSLGGKPARLLLNRDVTAERKAAIEREQLSRAIERAADEWHRTFDSVDVALVILDSHGKTTRLNRSAHALLGVDYTTVLGSTLGELGLPEPWVTASDVAARALETRSTTAGRAVDAARARTWELGAYLAPAGEGGEERVILTVRDVTRLAALQESLRHSETMAAMGSLVAGVAHEVRNPLFSISATVDALESELSGKQEYVELAELLRSQVGRLRQLMRDLLDYGKPPVLRLAVMNPREILRRAMRSCLELAKDRQVNLAEDFALSLPFPNVDSGRMEQVFQNLLANAIQHSPRGSKVTACARSCDEPDTPLELVIQDEGTGINPGELPHLFEPFYSRRKGGTGLGLSIVQRIVEAHGGRVIADNRESGGAIFVVRLPAGDAERVETAHG
ncbi:MAG: PAS domain S-box protein [Vicinamibacteria bacterium]